jgi:uncharacterized protein (DUF1499 family)
MLMTEIKKRHHMFKLSGKKPANLGSKNGKLAPVVNKPNNVSSQADVNDRMVRAWSAIDRVTAWRIHHIA